MPLSCRIIAPLSALLLLMLLAGGCGVYYNTFYNAKRAFNEAEDERKSTKPGQAERIRTNLYQAAIEKSLKVVENHPSSKYYDDALYVLGVSYFYVKDHAKAERRFREILANYPESDYARDSRLYLAKAMLQLDAESEAMEIFEDLFESKVGKEMKAEAAMALGLFQFEAKNYKLANRYFLAVRDTLGSDDEKRVAQKYIADGLFAQWRYADALGAYLQMLGMNPTPNDKYHALFRAAEACYALQRINTAQDYLQTLADDQLYFDSLAVLRLKIAEGHEWKANLALAEETYDKVISEAPNKLHQAQAHFMLGLIYQYDYDDLAKAKEHYDAAVTASRGSEWGQDALQLSSDIGKLETFARTLKIDSTTTQATIDEAAYTQYQLAELYWYKLNKPDTAMIEMQYVVDSFPTAYDAPKAIIALAQMAWQLDAPDSTRGDSILGTILERYPHSDFSPEAFELLGLRGTEADTGYAEYFFRRAEDFFIEENNIDSAQAYYQVVIDRFPESKYYLQARFAQIWLTETYASPGDSSVLFAYQALVDSFPSSEWGNQARTRLSGQVRRPQQPLQEVADTTGAGTTDPDAADPEFAAQPSDSGDYASHLDSIYMDPLGQTCINLPNDIELLDVRQPFEYPSEAFLSQWEGDLYFQIKLDFSGEVVEYIQKSRSPIEEIDLRAEEAVQSTVFDMRRIRPEWLDRWFMYKFRVTLPSHLR